MPEAARFQWDVAQRPLPGEIHSGDGHLVVPIDGGWLLAVADGLGHGPDAAAASDACIELLAEHADEPLAALVQRCHERLRTTRGVALAVAAVDERNDLLGWLGIGNVEAVLLHAGSAEPTAEYINMRPGIVGYRLPPLQIAYRDLVDGDTLVLATDGLEPGFIEEVSSRDPPATIVERALARFAKPNDDALILAARWRRNPRNDGPEP